MGRKFNGKHTGTDIEYPWNFMKNLFHRQGGLHYSFIHNRHLCTWYTANTYNVTSTRYYLTENIWWHWQELRKQVSLQTWSKWEGSRHAEVYTRVAKCEGSRYTGGRCGRVVDIQKWLSGRVVNTQRWSMWEGSRYTEVIKWEGSRHMEMVGAWE